MDTLPEELLAQILSYMHDHSDALHPHSDTATLHAICLTSRKLLRVGTPYLYQCIHSTSGTTGTALLRVLAADKSCSLRRHVRALAVQHTTQGCVRVSDKHAFDDEDYGHTYDACPITFARTVRLLPRLEVLDLSRLPLADEGGASWLGGLRGKYGLGRGDWLRGTGFEHVRGMALHLGDWGVEEMGVVFRLPALRELELDVRTAVRHVDWQHRVDLCNGWGTETSGVEVLRLVGLERRRVETMYDISRACVALKRVFVAVRSVMVLKKVPQIFYQHLCSGALEKLQVAVVGLWHYDLEVVKAVEEYNLTRLGTEFADLIMHATGTYERRGEMFESEHLRLVKMREQTESEKRNYDLRRSRRR